MLPPALGRRDLLLEVRAGLVGRRWVTLVGAPGVGKSLLARHTAEVFSGSTWVDVEPFETLDELVAECISLVAPDTAPGDTDVLALKRALDDSGRLLILDGVDDRVDGLGDLIESIMVSTTDAKILCTAPRSAGQPHEFAIHVAPLPIPEPQEALDGPAVELFVGRVAGAGGELIDLAADADCVWTLLDASGGLPLLIEQLAVQAAHLGLRQVVPQQSLSGTLATSYDLVDEVSQRAYRRLAVLGCPAGPDVLAAITGTSRPAAIGIAARLQRHTLVELHADGRVAMLAPMRRHALELAAETDRAEARAGILRWADATLPAGDDEGAADEAWLLDLDTLTRAIEVCAADPERLDTGYRLANRAFGALYTAMRPREALGLLELVLAAGDGPPDVGAQVARRAGISASEVRGTFEGLRFLDRAAEHAARIANPEVQTARTMSIRSEIYLDAGQLAAARVEAERVLTIAPDDSYVTRQAGRTLMDIAVCRGDLAEAEALAPTVIDHADKDEYWLAIAARILLAQIALEQGRALEAAALARAARDEAQSLAEDRIALIADVLHRRVSGEPALIAPEVEHLPWTVRMNYQSQGARDALAAGHLDVAAGRAADVIVLADSARLAREGIEARIVLGDALLAKGDHLQAISSYAAAIRRAHACPMPLRVADALDGIAMALARIRPDHAGRYVGAAWLLRRPRGAARLPRPGVDWRLLPPRRSSGDWVAGGHLSPAGLAATDRLDAGSPEAGSDSTVTAQLTKAQRAVAELVGQGMTSKEIAERLYISPRTVDNHLAQIYRRLDIPSRSRLAALMADA